MIQVSTEIVSRHKPYWNEKSYFTLNTDPFTNYKVTLLVDRCCSQIANTLTQCIKVSSAENYDKELKLLDSLPNFACVKRVHRRMPYDITNLSVQLKFNELFTKYGLPEPYNTISLPPAASIIDSLSYMETYFQNSYREKNCTVNIAFNTFVKDIGKLPQFNSVTSIYLYLSIKDTESILYQWISYLKLHRGEKWTQLQFLVIKNVPSAKLLYDILYLLPSLKKIKIGYWSKSFIEDIPIMKSSLKLIDKPSNLYSLSKKQCFNFETEVNALHESDSSLHTLSILYDDDYRKEDINLMEYEIIKPISALKRPTNSSNENVIRKRLKPRANIKGLFGHSFS